MSGETLAFWASAFLTAGLVWMLRPLASRHGLVDRPSGRKNHASPTPIIGGLAIALAVIMSLFLVEESTKSIVAYAMATVLLMTVGFLDDAYDLRWYWRMPAHVVAGLIMIYWGGVQVESIGLLFTSTPIILGAWSVPFTLLAIVGLINAINMTDGADGVAGSLCLSALLMFGAAALYTGNEPLFSWVTPLVSAIIVFLFFNMRFPWQRSARIFLGNAGSAFLGFTMGWIVFRVTQDVGHPVPPVLAPWFLAVPLVDCLVLIARRVRMGRSPFHADRGHIHHLMLDAGFSPNQVALTLSIFSIGLGVGAALLLRSGWASEGQLVLAFVVVAMVHYWLTARRSRALSYLGNLHGLLSMGRQSAGAASVALKGRAG